MAWLSIGSNNSDLCDKLHDNGVFVSRNPIHTRIAQAFRITDRGDFVQSKYRYEAYFDRPFKRDHIHISAPHMYVSVLTALDLQPGHAFLNVGSGSGYLSCLAACLLGEEGVSHGIDVNAAAVSHSKACCQTWRDNYLVLSRESALPPITSENVQFVHGNCFSVDIKMAGACRYDRIYVGAGCSSEKVEYFYDLLADDGVMVVPVDDTNELLKIHRIKGHAVTKSCVSQVHFAPLIPLPSGEQPLVRLPMLLWAPIATRHKQFPVAFRQVVKCVIFGRADMTTVEDRFVAQLPIHVWLEIFSYCTRDWFVPQRSPLQLALEELEVERSLRIAAEEKLRVAEAQRSAADRERDLCRLMMSSMRAERGRLSDIPARGYVRQMFSSSSAAMNELIFNEDESSDEEDMESRHSSSEDESEEASEEDYETMDEESDDGTDGANEILEEVGSNGDVMEISNAHATSIVA